MVAGVTAAERGLAKLLRRSGLAALVTSPWILPQFPQMGCRHWGDRGGVLPRPAPRRTAPHALRTPAPAPPPAPRLPPRARLPRDDGVHHGLPLRSFPFPFSTPDSSSSPPPEPTENPRNLSTPGVSLIPHQTGSTSSRSLDQKSPWPWPACPPPPPPAFSSFGRSATRHSVVSMSDETEAAFCSAVRTTFTGSMTPCASRLP